MQDEILISKIREGIDEIFTKSELSSHSKEIFEIIGIYGFANACITNKSMGLISSQNILGDIYKLSHIIYQNIDKLPIERNIYLPKKSGKYKFVITASPNQFYFGSNNGGNDSLIRTISSNVLSLISTGDTEHSSITANIGLHNTIVPMNDQMVFGGAWITINYEDKTIVIDQDSGFFGSCSNELVVWILQDYEDQGYNITVDMDSQRRFDEL